MALDKTQTATEIVAAIEALPGTATAQQRWEAAIEVLYTRIKADLVVESQVASGIPVSTTGTAAAQTGSTTSPGTATSSSIS